VSLQLTIPRKETIVNTSEKHDKRQKTNTTKKQDDSNVTSGRSRIVQQLFPRYATAIELQGVTQLRLGKANSNWS
jgi:hypothetical protein